MKKALFLFILSFFAKCLFSQEKIDYSSWPKDDQKIFERSIGLYEDKNYIIAYDGFKKLLASHQNDNSLKYLTGICGIFRSDKHVEALNLLNQVYEKNKKAADIEYYFALLYHRLGEFDKSLEYIAQLKKTKKLSAEQSKFLNKLVDYCNTGKHLLQTPIDVRISNIGTPPNSEYAEYSPVISADENTLIYTYRGKDCEGGLQNVYGKPDKYGFYYEDVYTSQKTGNTWSKGESIKNINTNLHDAVIAISPDGQELFTFKDDATGGGDIYSSKLEGKTWSMPRKLKGDINSTSWEGSVSLSANGKDLYFSSERPGGFGGRDLYIAHKKEDGSWGDVTNLGEKINTIDDEDSPFIHPDGLTLVFSSNGKNSMGGYDVFKTDFDEIANVWTAPENIGFPVNTTDDDIYYVLSADGKRGYYSSGKEGGYGDKDIYVVEPAITGKKTQLTLLSGSVTEDAKPIEAEIVVYIMGENKNFGTFKSNLETGNYVIHLPGGYDYRVTYIHKELGDQEYIVKTVNANSFTDYELNVNFIKGELEDKQNPEIVIPAKAEPELSNSFKNYEPDTAAVAKLKEAAIAISKSEKPGLSLNEIVKPKINTDSTKTVSPQKTVVEEQKAEPEKQVAEVKAMPAEKTKPEKKPKEIPEPKTSANAAAERLEMLDKYGNLKIDNLKYIVQVAAYRHPENYKSDKIKSLAEVKKANEMLGDITLLITNKEFDTWKEADAFLNEVKSAGQKDAFLTVMYNGKRLYLKDLVSQDIWASKSQVQ